MKILALSLAGLGLLAMVSSAQARTCEDAAASCSSKGGRGCYLPEAMASCHATGVYTAPSGTKWKATKVSGQAKK